MELEQIAISRNFRKHGIGTKLIKESLYSIEKILKERGSKIKAIEVTTGKTNPSQKLYERILGATTNCILNDFYEGDEILLISKRNNEEGTI